MTKIIMFAIAFVMLLVSLGGCYWWDMKGMTKVEGTAGAEGKKNAIRNE